MPRLLLLAIAVRIRLLSVHQLKLNLVGKDQRKQFSARPSLICHSMCGPGEDSDMVFGSESLLGWTQLV